MKSIRLESVKRLLLLLTGICILAGGPAAGAANPKHRPGLIVVAKVVGSVEATDPQGKTTHKLKKNDTLSEKYTVNVGAASSATLAFSNGAIINLLENTTLVISEFLQDPFSSPFASSELSQEPSTSVTRLQLVKGQMVGSVKKLRTEQGSSLIVNTPAGAAGVRGTTLAVSYVQNPSDNSKATYTLSVTEGEVEFTDSKGRKSILTAGQELVISVRQAVDPVTGRITIIEVLEIVVQDIPQGRRELIDQAEQDGNAAGEMAFIDFLNQPQFDIRNQNNEELIIIKPEETTANDP